MKKILLLIYVLTCSHLYSEVVLNFSSSNNDPERQAVIRYLFDAFELYNPDIKVNLLSYTDNDSADSILSGENGLTPHIIMADSLLLTRLSNSASMDHDLLRKLIIDLGENDFYKGGLEAFKSEGEYYGIPYSAWLQVIWYRKAWFEQDGLRPPETIDDLLTAAEFFGSKKTDDYGIILGSKQDDYMQQCFLHIASALGLSLLSDGNSLYLNKEPFIQALKYYKKLIQYTPPEDHDWRSRDYYFQNKTALLFYSTHLMDDLAIPEIAENSLSADNFTDLKGADFSYELIKNTGMVTTLQGNLPSSFGSISGLGLFHNNNTETKAAQEKLVHFLFRNDVYTTWLHMSPGGMLPVRRSILKEDNFYRDPGGVFKIYGREKLIDLISGLENLKILNTESLIKYAENKYSENDFKKLLYTLLRSDDYLYLIESVKWMR